MRKGEPGKWFRAAGFAAMLVAFAAGTALASYQVGDTVSNFTLQDPFGVTHRLSDYDGKIIVLNFFRHT